MIRKSIKISLLFAVIALLTFYCANIGFCCYCDYPMTMTNPVPSLDVVGVGQNITITVSAEDLDSDTYEPCTPEEDTVNYLWYRDGGLAISQGTNTFTTHWDTPGLKTVSVTAYDNALINDDINVTKSVNVLVVNTDIRADSNNDNTIDGVDDFVEEVSLGKKLYISGGRTEVTLECNPSASLTDYKVKLIPSSGGTYIKVWDSAVGGTEITSQTIFTVGEDLPSTVYVEGVGSGEAVLDMILFTPNVATEVSRDKVRFKSASTDTSSKIRVKFDSPNSPDGETWDSAYHTIAEAINTAQSGDEIWIASGTYNGGFTVPAGVSIYGGFSGNESSRPDWKTRQENSATIVNGQGGSVITIASGATLSTVVDCLQIQNGIGTSTYNGNNRSGGGIYCYNASPTISHNNILSNTLSATNANYGAGIYISGSSAVIVGNKIHANTAANIGNGGAICISSSKPLIANNLIYENSAQNGSGIYIPGGEPFVVNNTVVNNTGGYGIYYSNGYDYFYGIVTNNIVAYNTAGIYCSTGSFGSTVVTAALINNDVISNGDNYYPYDIPHTTDINLDPVFVNTASDVYNLQPTSPCIDAGTNEAPDIPNSDLDNLSRILPSNGNVDIGAYEFDGVTGSVLINSGNGCTDGRAVTLTLSALDHLDPSSQKQMQISNDGVFSETWENYSDTKSWELSPGDYGDRTVYVRYKNNNGDISGTCSDTIYYGCITGSISIDSGAATTADTSVELTLSAAAFGGTISEMQISNNVNFYDSSWQQYAQTKPWILGSGVPGERKVYVRYKTGNGEISNTYSDSIFLGNGQQVYCVYQDDGNDETNDGKSWSSPLQTIQKAIGYASPGDEIWVGNSYEPYSEAITLPAGVSLYGGFQGTDDSKEDRTGRDNEVLLTCPQEESVITVLLGAGNTVIDGFKIRGSGGKKKADGFYYGGAIYCEGASSTTISNNLIYNSAVTGTTCYGGGIYCSNATPIIINNILYSQNEVSSSAVWCSNTNLIFANNTVISNRTTIEGGGLYLDSCTGTVANNIVFENSRSGVHTAGTTYPSFKNNCVYRNGEWDAVLLQSATNNYTGVMADPTNDTNGNISADPLFRNYNIQNGYNTDITLSFLSPCVDAGYDSIVGADWLAIDHLPRSFDIPGRGSIVDIGAYEYADTTAPTISWIKPEGIPQYDYSNPSGCTCSTSQIYCEWYVSEDLSGISEIKYAIGESVYPPATFIVDWTSDGITFDDYHQSYWFRKPGLSLEVGNTYYVYIRVVDGAGNEKISTAPITIGCSNSTIEDALRCADGDIISCTLDDLVVTAGTSQFCANDEYHMYVSDNSNSQSRLNTYGLKYSLRVDFENGIPSPLCNPGDRVSIKGRMDTAASGERVMIIDLSDITNYHYAVTPDTLVPTVRWLPYLSDLAPVSRSGYSASDIYINKLKLPGVTRPLGTNGNIGKLVYIDSDGPYQISFVPQNTADKFFYVDDTTMRCYGKDSDGNLVPTDGNGLNNGVCAEGVRIDYSWIPQSQTTNWRTLSAGDYVKATGICAIEDIETYVVVDNQRKHEKVRLLRLRKGEDLQFGPIITSPAAGTTVQDAYPTFTFSDPINLKNRIDGTVVSEHKFVELNISYENAPSYEIDTIVQNNTNSVTLPSNLPDYMPALQPGVDYYAFVRVSDDDEPTSYTESWSPWSKGLKFKIAPSRLQTPVNGSTIWDDTPLISWRYDSTTESGDIYNAKITSTDGQTIYWSGNKTGYNNINCDTTLASGTYRACLKKSTETVWEENVFTVHPNAADSGQISTGEVEYHYGRYGNLDYMVDGRGTTTYEYDGLNRLVKTHLTSTLTEWNGQEVIYKHGAGTDKSGYDLRGNRTKMTTVSLSPSFTHPTKYEYTDHGQLAKLTDQLGGETKYEYDDMSLVSKTTYPNGTYTTYEYDSDRYWLTNITHMKSDQTTVIGSFTYSYNSSTVGKNGTRTSVSEYQLKPDNNTITAAVAYVYDDLYHLTSEVRTGDVPYSKSYQYDLAGNRTSMVDGSTTTNYSYDDANKLTQSITGSIITLYTYDGAGNQRTATTGSDVTTYTWGFRNMMTKWEKTGETAVEYGYDAFGMRVSIIPNGGTSVNFMLDGVHIIEEIISQNVISHLGKGWSLAGKLSSTGRQVFYADGTSSTRVISDSNQNITETSVYFAFGEELLTLGDVPSFGFGGQLRYFKDSTGLLYLKARYYDPFHARFTSRDPIGYLSGLNLYAYVSNDPVDRVDPSGNGDAWWPFNSRLCNRSSDQCMIARGRGGKDQLLKPGECTSWFFDDGDFGWWNGDWYKCGGGHTCYIDNRSPDDYKKSPHYLPPLGPKDPRRPTNPSSPGMCKAYCDCQKNSKYSDSFKDSCDCEAKCGGK